MYNKIDNKIITTLLYILLSFDRSFDPIIDRFCCPFDRFYTRCLTSFDQFFTRCLTSFDQFLPFLTSFDQFFYPLFDQAIYRLKKEAGEQRALADKFRHSTHTQVRSQTCTHTKRTKGRVTVHTTSKKGTKNTGLAVVNIVIITEGCLSCMWNEPHGNYRCCQQLSCKQDGLGLGSLSLLLG